MTAPETPTPPRDPTLRARQDRYRERHRAMKQALETILAEARTLAEAKAIAAVALAK